ncbi:L,D-transpeptidase [Rhizobiales bacterium]|uniref:L,D-transpeptidase n=1 Tax=Hongsoonwoonella zoysiae TaxID=2821844 RepID=UPI0015610D5B|nr:L,D-transpeptidase [Hongsoonwoonella zoysiae]NRG17023.1 L,D-transpeptidase [Hongsoonwoonella zoysiae]
MRNFHKVVACVFVSAILVAYPISSVEAASIVARIDLSEQRMRVYINGFPRHSWPVSTARRGYRTPVGSFRPGRMHRRYFSRKYDGAPMPWSVFFYHGYAIHGTDQIRHLGRPVSHGCVRLHPDNARRLFTLIKQNGKKNARIIVTR